MGNAGTRVQVSTHARPGVPLGEPPVAADVLRKHSMLFSSLRQANRPHARKASSVCFCTLAIHEPYRRRARLLCADLPRVPWVVLTDEPGDFAGHPVRAIAHAATGPMALDYLARLAPTGEGRGAAAYHDKRFALLAALEDHNSAVYVDADSRIANLTFDDALPAGIAVLPVVRKSVAEHLATCGTWRLPVFEELAKRLTGDTNILNVAQWCHETLIAVTKDGREAKFFDAWGVGADFLQTRGVYSGEGGVIGLAAAHTGWAVDYDYLAAFGSAIQHEGGGPKDE